MPPTFMLAFISFRHNLARYVIYSTVAQLLHLGTLQQHCLLKRIEMKRAGKAPIVHKIPTHPNVLDKLRLQ